MAVPTMLEIVPRGINKWVGMQLLLAELGIEKDALMSCGDGSNDLQLVSNSGVGIAMGNAVPEASHRDNQSQIFLQVVDGLQGSHDLRVI